MNPNGASLETRKRTRKMKNEEKRKGNKNGSPALSMIHTLRPLKKETRKEMKIKKDERGETWEKKEWK